MNTAQAIIEALQLKPHPEGGYFKEVYRSKGVISAEELGAPFKGDRNFATSIYFLLTSDTFSAFHRINQDEIWHFYDGSPLLIHVIDHNGKYSVYTVGRDIRQGQRPQLVVAAGDWFAAEVVGENSFAFVGCGVAPGFDFADFEMPSRQSLIELYPTHKSVIERFTRL